MIIYAGSAGALVLLLIAIQILSDLHPESPKGYDIFDIPPNAPYLALLGDVGYASKHYDDYCDFLKRQKRMREFEQEVRNQRSATETKSIGEFVLLDRTRYDIPASGNGGDTGVTILGTTLFSRVLPESAQDVSFGVLDFYKIGNWTVEEHTARQVDALNSEGKKVVIFTHYSPTVDDRATDPIHHNSKIQQGFVTDLREEQCWKSKNVKLWAFGHTHFNCDFMDDQKRVLAH
ncbi:Ser/Thr protein phosphatase superfamily [Nemania sp. FL0031]|nr:Ser/Thr protein phosphatase superfamily [Nemania sp. FL0031]